MIIVADSSALIALATCVGLDLLTQLYDQVSVPEAVYLEVTEPDKPNSIELDAFLQNRVHQVDSGQYVFTTNTLGHGELEAMALYKKLSADALLIDDNSRTKSRRSQSNQLCWCIGNPITRQEQRAYN